MKRKINTSSLEASIEEAKKNLEKLLKQKESAEAFLKKSMEAKREEIREQIEEKIRQAGEIIKECEVLADEYELDFSINFGGYGSGSTYYSEKKIFSEDEDWNESSESGWMSSSNSC